MHVFQGLTAFLLCFITCAGGTTCPQVCTCANTTLNCAFKFLTDVPALDGSFVHIDFSRNRLTSLSTSDIHLSGQSCTIDYSYNQLSRGISNISPECEQLSANFSHNNFQDSLPSHFIFSNSGPDFTMDLSFNKLQRVEKNTINLYNSHSVTIDLSHNMISYIDPNAFKVRHHITKIYLTLGYNRLTSFTQLSIYHVSTKIQLDVSHNLLTHLADSDIKSYSQLQINFARNPWSCNCHQSWIADSGSQFREVISNEPEELLCNQPPNMKDRPVLELAREEFSCPPELDTNANLQITANPGDTVVLRCPYRGAVPPVQLINWTFVPGAKPASSGMISFSTSSDTPPEIHNVTCELTGKYFCHVGNIGGSIRPHVTLSVNAPCKDTILTGLCVALAVLLVILLLIALTISYKKTSGNFYVFKTNKNQLRSMQSVDQKVTLAEVLNKEVNSTVSDKIGNENGNKANESNSAVYSDTITEEGSDHMSHGKDKKFKPHENRRKIDSNFDGTQVRIVTQTDEEQYQDQVYSSNNPLGQNQQAKKTKLNENLPLAAKGTENTIMDEDMYLVPNDILTPKGPHLHSHDNYSGGNLQSKQTKDNKMAEIYMVPDQTLIPKTLSGERGGIPIYLEILSDKQKPSSMQPLGNVKTTGIGTKTSKANNGKNLKHKKKLRNKEDVKNSQGQQNLEAIPRLMDEYLQKKNKQEKDEDGNVYSDAMQLKELCEKEGKEMKGSKKEEGQLHEKDDLDEEMYLIPNKPK